MTFARLIALSIYSNVVQMKTSNISYLRNHLSEVLSYVKEGETVLVMDRKKPVATLTPYTASKGTLSPRLQDLQNQGLLTHEPSKLPSKIAKPLKLKPSVDVVRYILEDRECLLIIGTAPPWSHCLSSKLRAENISRK